MIFVPLSVAASILHTSAASITYPNFTNTVTSYEVTPPIPDYSQPCASMVIVDQSFGNSYGHPAYFDFTPPQECPDFTHVTAEIQFETSGFQYDRSMHLLKDSIEIWRPSTPEPVGHNVTSKESKDLSRFVNMFRTPGKIEFDLDNSLLNGNQGGYYTNVTLSFYNEQGKSVVNDDSWFYGVDEPANNFDAVISGINTISNSPAKGQISTLSRNTTRAVLNIYASGNADEEFWYTSNMSQDGPTRLIQVFINGVLAGVSDPFPVIYTGGMDPGLWQPLLGSRASDVPSYIVDITPFLPDLWERDATVEVAVGNGYGASQSTQSNWLIDTSLLTWETPDSEGSGYILSLENITHGQQNDGSSTFNYGASYNFSVTNSAILNFNKSGQPSFSGIFTWTQNAASNNTNIQTNTTENVTQTGQGFSESQWKPINGTSNAQIYIREHQYPLQLRIKETADGQSNIFEQIERSYSVQVTNNGEKFWLEEEQNAEYHSDNGYESINDVYESGYHRHVESTGETITQDTTSNT